MEGLKELETADLEDYRRQRSRLMTLGSQLGFQARYEKDKKAAAAAKKAADDDAARTKAEEVAAQAPTPGAKKEAEAILAQALDKRDLGPYSARLKKLIPPVDLGPLSAAIARSAATAKSVDALVRGSSPSKAAQHTLAVTPKLVPKHSLVD